jgi:hypothetical protein
VTADVGQLVANKSREVAADLRRSQEAAAGGAADATETATPAAGDTPAES